MVKDIGTLALKKGLTYVDNIAYGEVLHYLLAIYESPFGKEVLFTVNFNSNDVREEFETYLKNMKVRYDWNIKMASVKEKEVNICFAKDTEWEKVSDFIDMFCQKMDISNVSGSECCSKCGEYFNGEIARPVLVNKRAYKFHSHCSNGNSISNNSYSVTASTPVDNNMQGSIFFGILGAFLGAAIGAIPWAIAYYFGWFVAWLGWLIGIASHKGYELAGGKKGKTQAVVVVIVVLLMVVLAEFFTLSLTVTQSLNEDLGFMETKTSFFDSCLFTLDCLISVDYFGFEFLKDIALGWVFAILGLFSMIKEIFVKTKIEQAKKN